MNPSDPLDLSGYAPDVQRWLERVKPTRLLPALTPGCARCRDSHIVPVVGSDGHTRYEACGCVRQHDSQARARRLAAQTDMKGLEDVRLEGLVPIAAQYAAYRVTQDLIRTPQGLVVLFGRSGTGKTQFAAAVAWGLVDRLEVAYYEAPGLVRYLRSGGKYDDGALEERLDQLKEVGLLVIDGLGTEPQTEWANASLQELINARYRMRRPLFLTTCVPLADMSEMLAARLLDMSRTRLAVIPGTLRQREQWTLRASSGWPGGPAHPTVYDFLGEPPPLICPTCQARPCLSDCPAPLFAAPETPA